MQQTQLAIIDYLEDGQTEHFSDLKTIKKYHGEIARAAIMDDAVRKFNDPLPAVYVTLINGTPISQDPTKNFDLLLICEDAAFDKDLKEYDAMLLIDKISSYIEETPGWTYNGKPYLIDTEKYNIRTLLSDSRFIIFSISLTIKNLL